jgi:hypothetical protein
MWVRCPSDQELRVPSLTALAGAATAAFSAALVVAPTVLIRPCGLTDTRQTRALVRMVGVRDVVSGAALLTASPGRSRRSAVAGRVACDWADAAALAAGLAGQQRRPLVAASAVAWGLVCLAAGVLDERTGR